MRNVKYTFWQDGDFFLGYLNEYQDYWTQGFSKDELLENLKDLLTDFESREKFLLLGELKRWRSRNEKTRSDKNFH